MADIEQNNQNPQREEPVVSPDQLSMFQDDMPEVTRIDIPHQVLNDLETAAADQPAVEPENHVQDENVDEVTGAKKIKVLAALAIVAGAGYIAYWVQEPVQIKAEVTGADVVAESIMSDMPQDTLGETSLVALETSTSPSVNVDVSLFGFEPATVKVDKGTTVIWTNTSTEDQTIVGSSEEGQSFVSPVLASGDSFSYQFDQDSSFQYYSTYNPALKASITVGLGSPLTDDVLPAADEQVLPGAASSTVISPVASATQAPTSSLEDGITQTQALSSSMETANLPSDISAGDELKQSAPESPTKLTKTGPEDLLYLLVIFTIGWFNRKSLLKAFKKY